MLDSIYRGGETIIIKRFTETNEKDDFGMPLTTETQITLKNCLIQFGSTDEPIDINRNAEDASLTLFLPAGTVILDGDIFEIRQTIFVKDGMPLAWQSPFDGFDAGVVVIVRKRHG